MTRRMFGALVVVFGLAVAAPASAQLVAAKDGPIVYGHHHLASSNIEASSKFFATLGGRPGKFAVIFVFVTVFLDMVGFGLVMPVLLVVMTIKFYLIAAYFMHLRWDKPILRRAFMTGLGIALVVYVIALTAFKFWNGPGFMPR